MKTVKSSFRHDIVVRDINRVEQVERAKQARAVVIVFVLSALFMSTGLGMVGPVFAHVFKEASSGVRSLSFMMMVPQIALLVLSPLVGGLEDRYGRRPFLLLGFAGLVVTNTGYLFAHSAAAYTGIRLVQAIAGVGIVPATLGILADVVPEQQRTRRISLILAGHAGGLALGPIIGGFLLQGLGTTAPFGVSALLNLIAFGLVCLLLPKVSPTWTNRRRAPGRQPRTRRNAERIILSLMVPLSLLAGLLALDFVSAFARTFVEPQQAVYLYKILKFTPVQFGLLMSSRGVTMLLGQLLLSRWGDSVNRRVVVALGLVSHAFFLFSLLSIHQFALLFLVSLFVGIGGGVVHPLLSACYLETSAPQHHSRIIGIKEAIGAFGEIAGSLVVVLASPWLKPQSTFLLGGCIIVGTSLLAFFVVKSSPAPLASPALSGESCQDDQPTLPLSRVRLADLPTLPLSRVRLADQPTLVGQSIPQPDQPVQPLEPALTASDERAWFPQRSQRGFLHVKLPPNEPVVGASRLANMAAVDPSPAYMTPGAGERARQDSSL